LIFNFKINEGCLAHFPAMIPKDDCKNGKMNC